MANSNNQSKGRRKEMRKERKGDTSRTSNQGQKLSSGGRAETDNQGRPTDDNPQTGRNGRTGSSGKIL